MSVPARANEAGSKILAIPSTRPPSSAFSCFALARDGTEQGDARQGAFVGLEQWRQGEHAFEDGVDAAAECVDAGDAQDDVCGVFLPPVLEAPRVGPDLIAVWGHTGGGVDVGE